MNSHTEKVEQAQVGKRGEERVPSCLLLSLVLSLLFVTDSRIDPKDSIFRNYTRAREFLGFCVCVCA